MRPKTVFMLTATPINNRLSDFRHMAELFTRRDEAYSLGRWALTTLGLTSIRWSGSFASAWATLWRMSPTS